MAMRVQVSEFRIRVQAAMTTIPSYAAFAQMSRPLKYCAEWFYLSLWTLNPDRPSKQTWKHSSKALRLLRPAKIFPFSAALKSHN